MQSAQAAGVEVTTFAGFGGAGDEDGAANVAKFNQPRDLIIKNDIAYLLDRNGIRQISPNGTVTTIFRFSGAPLGTTYCSINIDGKDVFWLVTCDGSSLIRVSKSGQTLGTITISSSQGWIGYPHSAAFLPDGRLLVPVWYVGKIFAVSETGAVTTYFSNPNNDVCGGQNSKNSPSTLCPFALAVNSISGEVFFANSGGSSGLYKINSSSSATRIASATFPHAVRFANNTVFHATLIGGSQNKRVQVSRLDAGQNSINYANLEVNARWLNSGFDIDSKGNIFLPLHESHIVLVYRSSGELIQTIGNAGHGNLDGALSRATFYRPSGIVESETGDIYVKEVGGIRKISKAGQVSTIYKSEALWNDSPMFLHNGRLYYVDNSNYLVSLDPNTATLRSEYLVTSQPEYLASNRNIAFDSKGNLYALVVKNSTDYSLVVRRYSSNGSRQDLPNITITNGYNTSIFIDSQDNITIAQSGQMRQYDTNGTPLTLNGVSNYFGNDPLILFDNGKPSLVLSTDFRTYTLAGNTGNSQEILITGAYAGSVNQSEKSSFYGPKSMIRLSSGELLIADTDNNVLRKVVITPGANTSSNVWQPRPTTSVPRPAGLLSGLSQTTFNSYFEDKLDIFTRSPSEAVIVDSVPVWSDFSRPNKSYEWTGYFIPDFSGNWSFRLTSDDAAYVWLGMNAVSSFRNTPSSALVSLPGTHAELTTVGSINLVKDRVYPFRINYGNWENSLAVLKLEFKPPGFDNYETNFKSLVWYSTPGNCTNWGIDYVLANTLSTEKFQVPSGCNTASAANTSSSSSASSSSKPTTPTFSGVNFSGNKINIAVNIGSNSQTRPDKVYLVAPKLGFTAANPLAGKISGSSATWTVDFDKLLAGTMIPLEVVGEKNGVRSESASASYQAPGALLEVSRVPAAPKNYKQRIVGSSAVVTVEATLKAGALATNAYIFSKSMGIAKTDALEGEVVGSKVVFELPIKASMAGKKFPLTIYLSNQVGDSKPLDAVLAIPAAPKVPSVPNINPKPVTPTTVICIRASQTRAFAGKKCPPGWNEK
jgi:hypothetical protein